MNIPPAEFNRMFAAFTRSAFRLQLLPVYDVTDERDEYAKFLAGEPLPDRKETPWLAMMGEQVAQGRTWTTIHLLPPLMTPYLRYLIDWWYVYQAKADASIGFLRSGHESAIQALATRDFWLFDDATLVVLEYDPQGGFLGAKHAASSEALAAARRARDFAMANVVELRVILASLRTGQAI